MIHHIQLSIETAKRLANGDRFDQNRIKRVLGYRYIQSLREDLYDMEQAGFVIIPTEGCAHDGTGRCPGHKKEQTDAKEA